MIDGRRRWGLTLSLGIFASITLWIAWASWSYRLARRAVAEARDDIEAGRHATAARKLSAFLAQRPDSDEAAFLLGTCEKATGRLHAAAEAWHWVRPGSPFAPRAIQKLVELEVEAGQFAAAEQLVEQAMDDPRNDATALPLFLGPIYWLQGRIVDAEQSIEARWRHFERPGAGASEKAIDLVRLHIELTRKPLPVESVRQGLDDAGRLAPDDHRVWLGKANLAIRTGMYDQAERWIVACLARSPRDVAVWRSRLDWAVATNRVTEARDALKHLPVDASPPAQVHKVAAWLASRRGDRESERQALEHLISADPADSAALDRLAALATERGDAKRAEQLRQQKTEIERLRARYQSLYERYQPVRDAAEMATLGDRLGRRFEARAFKTLAVAIDPDRDDLKRELARLDILDRPGDEPTGTLADALANESRPTSGETTPATPRVFSATPSATSADPARAYPHPRTQAGVVKLRSTKF